MADEPADPAGTKQSRLMLMQSERALEDLLLAFGEMTERMLAGHEIPVAELSKTRTAFAHVRSQLVEEVNKHEKRTLISRGLVETAPIDFDAMRHEIGRRLDRVRDAEGSAGISDELEQ